MASLKSFLPELGECLRVSPLALYERQRVLVRLGVLTERKGRGPGSGVELTADAVAALLASLLITDNLSEVDARVGRLLKAPVDHARGRFAPMPEAPGTFGKMLSHILTSDPKEGWIISVDRPTLSAMVGRSSREPNDVGAVANYGKGPVSFGPGILTEAKLRIGEPLPLVRAFQSAVSK